MALIFADRVKEITDTSGTGSFVLAGASSGYRTFLSAVGNGNTCYYCCVASNGDWEIGKGTYAQVDNTIARTNPPIASSNANAQVSFGTGSKEIFLTVPASEVASNTKYVDDTNGKTYRIGFSDGSIVAIEV